MITEQSVDELLARLFSGEEANLYAVLDGASVEGLVPKLHELQPEFECLYRGELQPDMVEVSPYLVRLDPDVLFTRWVVAQGWGNHWGIFAASDEDLRTVRRHFRTFLIVHDPDGKPLYFRYYDPRVLRLYLPTCNAAELKSVFGPVSSYLLEGEDRETMLRFRFDGGALVRDEQELEPKAS